MPRGIDNGTANCIEGTTTTGDPSQVGDYCFRPEVLGNVKIPVGPLQVSATTASSAIFGTKLTSGQANDPGMVTCQAPASIPCITYRARSADQLIGYLQSSDYSESTTAGNECHLTAYGIPICTNGSETVGQTLMMAPINYIASETGANNAIVGTLGTFGPPLQTNLTVTVLLAHSLQAGANTFAFAGGGATAIRSSRNPVNNIATAYTAKGEITLKYCPSPACVSGTNVWLDTSQ